MPHWQKVPGTTFIVDRFGRQVEDNNQSCTSWFLTHFHADHYGGLSGRFKSGEPPAFVCPYACSVLDLEDPM